MRTLLLAIVLLLPAVALAPPASSQAVAAEGCVRMCDPNDATVNRAPSAFRAVWSFLYASQPEKADLVLVPPGERVSTLLGDTSIPALGCYTLTWTLGDDVNLTKINAAHEGSAGSPARTIELGGEMVLLFLYVRIPQSVSTLVPVRVDATIREGLDGSGRQWAEGSLEAELDGQRLWELLIPLESDRTDWNFARGFPGFLLDIKFCITKGNVAPAGLPVEFVSGPRTPARLLLSTYRSLETRSVRAIVEPDAVRILHTVIATFGAYDVDAKSATIEIVGRHAKGPWEPELATVSGPDPRSYDQAPVILEWRINKTEFFDNTQYALRARVSNLQGTSYTEADAAHRSLVFGGEARVPGLSVPFALLALVGLVAYRRRRDQKV